jgi:hypothetical protein
MSQDGAHQGISAKRALETILGGKRAPKKREEQTRAQVRERLAKAPAPGDASPDDYGDAADSIARAFLAVLADAPETPLDGTSLWDGVKKKWPDFDEWVGGATGFQVGWAVNCVRWLSEEPQAPNPALVTL